MRAVLVLPLVPVMWIAGYARCGSPRMSISAIMRSRDGSILVSPQRSASSASTARSASASCGVRGLAAVSTACPSGAPVRRVRLPASMTARSGSRPVSFSTISSNSSGAGSLLWGYSLTAPVYGAGRVTRSTGRSTARCHSVPPGPPAPGRPTAGVRTPSVRTPAVGCGSALREGRQLRGDALDVRLGRLLALPDAGDDLVRCLGQERLVAELGVGLRQLLLGDRQVLGEPLALRRDVDRAGQVELDGGAGDRQRGGGGEVVTGRLQPQQLRGWRPRAGPATCRSGPAGPGPAVPAAGPGRRGSGGPR